MVVPTYSEDLYYHPRERPGPAGPTWTCSSAAGATWSACPLARGRCRRRRRRGGGAQRVLEGRAGAGEGGSVAPVAWTGQGVKEPARGGDPADRGGRVRDGRVDRDFHGFCTILHIWTDRYVHEEGPMKMLRCLTSETYSRCRRQEMQSCRKHKRTNMPHVYTI